MLCGLVVAFEVMIPIYGGYSVYFERFLSLQASLW